MEYANGSHALSHNTTGNYNTANGVVALSHNTTGSGNTANGSNALESNTTGNENTANGAGALRINTTGEYNTSNGSGALLNNTTGNENTANGSYALKLNTTGSDNTANGYQALNSNTTGSDNTANGVSALYSNTTGFYNTANGNFALRNNTTGYHNTANGYRALNENSTQGNNTAVGYYAGDIYTFSQGTFIGTYAYPDNNGYSNVMGLGYQARPEGSNQVHIGNTSVGSIKGNVSFTTFSDGRYKISIQENVKGLDFIMKLRPITYKLDASKLAADLGEDRRRDESGNITVESSEIDIKARNEKSQIVYTGFVAQEVERAAKELGYDFSGVDAPQNEKGHYGLRYAEFVVPLVRAVQEQQEIIEELTKRIEELERK